MKTWGHQHPGPLVQATRPYNPSTRLFHAQRLALGRPGQSYWGPVLLDRCPQGLLNLKERRESLSSPAIPGKRKSGLVETHTVC